MRNQGGGGVTVRGEIAGRACRKSIDLPWNRSYATVFEPIASTIVGVATDYLGSFCQIGHFEPPSDFFKDRLRYLRISNEPTFYLIISTG
jgi:hypothetical protein